MAQHRPFRFGAISLDIASCIELVAYARKVERLGYATLGIGEHIAWGGLGPLTALAAAADATTTLRLTSHMIANDFRHPALLAQEAASIDLLSNGRLELGMGAGWLRSDYTALGMPFDPAALRVARLAEAVQLIKRLFGDAPVTFEGQHYQVHELNLIPKPVQRPHPPIFLGGGGHKMLSLAAQEAGIVSLDPKGTPAGTKDFATITAEAVAQQVAWVRQAAGTRFDDLELHLIVYTVAVTDAPRQAAQQFVEFLATAPPTLFSITTLSIDQVLASPHILIGTVGQIVEVLQERRKQYGISYITVPPDSVDALSPVVEQLTGI